MLFVAISCSLMSQFQGHFVCQNFTLLGSLRYAILLHIHGGEQREGLSPVIIFKALQLIPGHCLFEEFGGLFPVALCCSNGLSVFSFSVSQSRYMLPAKNEVKI